ncbi:MAG: biotin/lipoyl-containing protein, partial [Bryobacteraceae bacterium]
MIDVVMPQMGESIVEGTLTKWLKKVGETVERDEPLFEISTDKVDTEIPSPAAGVLSEILIEEGKTVGINTIVGRIGDSAGIAASAPAAVEAAPAAPTPAAPAPTPVAAVPAPAPVAAPPIEVPPPAEEQAGPLSPLVRKMAREYNIDLAKVRGTGAGGRITKQDVENFLAQSAAPTAPSAAPVAAPAAPVAAPAAPAPVYVAPPPAPASVPATRPAPIQVPPPAPAQQAPAQFPGAAPR